MARFVIRIARRAGIVALFVLAAMAGTRLGLLFAYSDDLPQISALDDYAPSTITRVKALDGDVIGEFATQRRIVIGYDDIPVSLRQAIIAAEDAGFDSHFGLSIPRIVITATRDIVYGQRAGASTLTQQLARNLFLTLDKTWERKVKEAILTVQIEKRYTKREIFTLYCNHMYFGHGDVRRRGGVARVFRQAGARPDARRGGPRRGDRAAARAPEPVRGSGRARHAGATTSCSGWPTKVTSRRPTPTQPSRSRSS